MTDTRPLIVYHPPGYGHQAVASLLLEMLQAGQYVKATRHMRRLNAIAMIDVPTVGLKPQWGWGRMDTPDFTHVWPVYGTPERRGIHIDWVLIDEPAYHKAYPWVAEIEAKQKAEAARG